jgi:hypothetical protein
MMPLPSCHRRNISEARSRDRVSPERYGAAFLLVMIDHPPVLILHPFQSGLGSLGSRSGVVV